MMLNKLAAVQLSVDRRNVRLHLRLIVNWRVRTRLPFQFQNKLCNRLQQLVRQIQIKTTKRAGIFKRLDQYAFQEIRRQNMCSDNLRALSVRIQQLCLNIIHIMNIYFFHVMLSERRLGAFWLSV